jgi:hypothetical protein
LAAFRASRSEGIVGRNSDGQTRLGAILGHLIAHEIGHLLLGTSHSSKGIMSSLLGPLSLGRAISGKLQFTSEEARQIRGQMEKRIQAAQLVR